MATQRKARIVQSQELNPNTRLLTLAMEGMESLNFVGGQYIIVNTNIPLPGNKIAKRAYSILSSDGDQTHFNIAVKKVGEGPGSNYMHHTQEGSELFFSGPWGQFMLNPDNALGNENRDEKDRYFFEAKKFKHTFKYVRTFLRRKNSYIFRRIPFPNALSGLKEGDHKNSALVLATDTGITAALGLVQSQRFKSQIKESSLLWLAESSQYFIPEMFVRDLIKDIHIDFLTSMIPPVGSSERLGAGLSIIRKRNETQIPEQVFLSGDGDLLYPFREELKSKGLEESKIKIECFFNNPFKKV